jgi:tRNA-2-methylthio-N6-dimethylallyladenosine synthase
MRDDPSCAGKPARISPFVQLLEAVHTVDGIERIRFTSPHPIGFRDDLISAFRDLPKLMPHVHFPLQSGSDRILKAMHRGYTAEKYFGLTEKLRVACPDIALTTDIIVGFPGETDEDYAATRALVERVSFDNAFIFRYSKRRDTPAAEMPDQLPESVKEERNQDLLQVVDRLARSRAAVLVGTRQTILCEGASKTNADRLMGRTPQNKIVVFEGDSHRHTGRIFDVMIERSTGFTLYGNPAVLS